MATKVRAKKRATKVARRGRTSTSRISSKNQVTIPVDILRRAGLKEGDEVGFAINDNGNVEIAIDIEDEWSELSGIYERLGITFEDLIKEREMWWPERS